MKSCWPLIFIVLLTGCLSTRKVSKTEDKFKGFETSEILRTAPGDNISIPLPRTPKDRPKSTTKTYTGDNGATSKKTFDEQGYITQDEINCPEITEREKLQREWEHEQSIKESERAANIELANTIGNKMIWIAAIFALAWMLKGLTRK
tara:strand:+ start:627 stop:1070 length:444 start_codon:yes stop_codon:yes gene_type:complete